jgi:hypothetical protein
MNLTHLRAFTDAMQRKDLEDMLTHMADDIILKTPLIAEPFKGKAAIRPVVEALLGVVDKFDFREMMQGPQHRSCRGLERRAPPQQPVLWSASHKPLS